MDGVVCSDPYSHSLHLCADAVVSLSISSGGVLFRG